MLLWLLLTKHNQFQQNTRQYFMLCHAERMSA